MAKKTQQTGEHIDRCRILYEAWEMQCCGEPIAVGRRITLHGAKIPGEYHWQTRANDADYFHQHHVCEEFMYDLRGKVETIVVIYRELIDGKVVEKERKEVPLIDGWTEGGDPSEYIITLTDVSVIERGYILRPDREV